MFRASLMAVMVVASATLAQRLPEDRPQLIEIKPKDKADEDRRRVDQLMRDAMTNYGIGVLHQRNDRLIDALKSLEKAASIDPESKEVRKALVPLYVLFAREPEALAACRHVLERDPFDADVSFQYARMLRVDSRPDEAIKVLKKAVGGKPAKDRPERLLTMLADLSELHERAGDHAGVAAAEDQAIETLVQRKDHLLYGHGLSKDDLLSALAKSYERLGQARLKLKQYELATQAFRLARDTYLKTEDPSARHQAARINWYLCELCFAQGRWADALGALDTYLQHGPADIEPYEKLVELLRKVGRERDIVPELRRYAIKEEFNLGVKLLLARELAAKPVTRPEAEKLYVDLLAKTIKPEIYRGLFRLYRDDGRMGRVLDLFDEATQTVGKKDEFTPAARNAAAERGRAMLQVLRTDADLVKALLPEARKDVLGGAKREVDTWRLLASLAARTRLLEDAERFFRQALVNVPPQQAFSVHAGLIDVLRMQKKWDRIVQHCREELNGRRMIPDGMENLFRPSLALALADLGQFDEALKQIDRAIEISNDALKVRRRCDKVQILSLAGQFGEGEKVAIETLKEFPAPDLTRTVRFALSSLYSRNGQHDKSEALLREILEHDPSSPLANNNLGYQLADRNVNLEEAERRIRLAIETDNSYRRDADEVGENAAYLDSLGWVLFRRGKLAEAKKWLEKAASLPEGEDDPTVWEHLGDVCARMGKSSEAKSAWEKAIKLYENAPGRPDPKRIEVARKLKEVQ